MDESLIVEERQQLVEINEFFTRSSFRKPDIISQINFYKLLAIFVLQISFDNRVFYRCVVSKKAYIPNRFARSISLKTVDVTWYNLDNSGHSDRSKVTNVNQRDASVEKAKLKTVDNSNLFIIYLTKALSVSKLGCIY